MKAVIPAAGMGTRMLPATKSMPKEMLPVIRPCGPESSGRRPRPATPVVDKPVIQYVVEEAAA